MGSDPHVMPQYGATLVEPVEVGVAIDGVVTDGVVAAMAGGWVVVAVAGGGVVVAVAVGVDDAEGGGSGAARSPQPARATSAAMATRTGDDDDLIPHSVEESSAVESGTTSRLLTKPGEG